MKLEKWHVPERIAMDVITLLGENWFTGRDGRGIPQKLTVAMDDFRLDGGPEDDEKFLAVACQVADALLALSPAGFHEIKLAAMPQSFSLSINARTRHDSGLCLRVCAAYDVATSLHRLRVDVGYYEKLI